MRTSEKAKAELEKLIQLFEKGEAPQAIAKVVLTCPDMPSAKWTLSNRLLAFVQTLETDCRGYKQWEKVDRHVKKGAHAAFIIRPNTIKKKDEENGEEKTVCTGFGCLPVFPMSETQGKSLPELTPKEPPALMDVASKLNLNVDYQAFGGMYFGFYKGTENQIVLSTHEEQVFFHELAHAAHERVLGHELKVGQDPKQEIVAELCACVLARLYGKKTANEGSTYTYITNYTKELKKELSEVLVSIISDVEKVLTFIIGQAEQEEPAAVAV